MKNWVQIIYISRSTFVPTESSTGIEPNVARILHKSRSNNAKNGLVGVLYFGNGNFFQCLEGDEEAVDTLYKKLEEDQRHKDITLLSKKRITAISFSSWAMKYVPIDQSMQKLLLNNGYSHFDPYQFDDGMTQKVIELLMTAKDADVQPLAHAADRVFHSPEKPASNAIAKAALAFSVAAFILSSAAIYWVSK